MLTGREVKFESSGRPELGIATEALAGGAREMIGEGAAGRVGVEPLGREWGLCGKVWAVGVYGWGLETWANVGVEGLLNIDPIGDHGFGE